MFDDSVYVANCDDGQVAIWCADMAISTINWDSDPFFYRKHLGCRKNLPNRYPDVWQENHLEGNDEMGVL